MSETRVIKHLSTMATMLLEAYKSPASWNEQKAPSIPTKAQ